MLRVQRDTDRGPDLQRQTVQCEGLRQGLRQALGQAQGLFVLDDAALQHSEFVPAQARHEV